MDVDPDTLSALLKSWPVARLATITPGGLPHLLPLVFVAFDGAVYSPVDAKRKSSSSLARLRNIEANGRAALLIDEYADDWSRLWWVRLDGAARVERDDPALLGMIEERLRRKYPQYRSVAPFSREPTLLALRWQRVSAWSQKGDLGPIRVAAGLPPTL